MAKSLDINRSLKKALFDSPTPLAGQGFFRTLMPAMFGDPTRFVDFLSENDHQKRIERAKDIVLSLAFSLPCTLPNWLVYNLLSYETAARPNNQSAYIPQDHFVHSVYNYLLGIYFYFYHSGISTAESDYFNLLRGRSANSDRLHSRKDRDKAGAQDFIYSWKLFCISHDIGYPWEEDRSGEFLKPFFQVGEAVTKDASTRAIAYLIAFHLILNEDQATALRFDLRHLPPPTKLHALTSEGEAPAARVVNLLMNRSTWLLLPFINGPMYVRTLSCIYSHKNIVAVLESKGEDRPELILADVEGTHHVLYRRNEVAGFGDIESAVESAFYTGVPLKPNQAWRYYVESPSNGLTDFIRESLGDQAIIDFNKVLADARGKARLNLAMVTTEIEYRELAFAVFKDLLQTFQYDDSAHEQGDIVAKYELRQKIYRAKFVQFIDNVVDKMRQHMNTNIRKSTATIWEDRNVPNQLRASFGNWSTTGEMVDELAGYITPQLTNELDIESAKLGAFLYVRRLIETVLPSQLVFRDITQPLDAETIAATTVAKDVGGLVNHAYGEPLNLQAFLEYRPDWASIPNFVDHGVASALILMEVREVITAAIAATKDGTPSHRLIRLGLGVGELSSIGQRDHDIGELTSEAAFAVLLHNIYPIYLPKLKEKSRTSVYKSPFLYVSMLVDAMQPWNRTRQIDQGKKSLPPKLTSDTYDIQIRGNLLLVFLGGDEDTIRKLDDSFRAKMEEYLEGSASLIRLTVAEWR